MAIEPVVAGDCEVWWASPRSARPALLDLLDAAERTRWESFVRRPDRDRFLVGAALLRSVAGEYAGLPPSRVAVDRRCSHCGKPHGRPGVPGLPLALSVSHSADVVVVAVGRVARLGVDVERVDDALDLADVAPAVLADEEATYATDPARFTTYWVRKEAVLKATGDGLRVPLRDVVVSPPDAAPALAKYVGHPELPARTGMATLRVPTGYAGALAAVGCRVPRVSASDGDALLARTVTPA